MAALQLTGDQWDTLVTRAIEHDVIEHEEQARASYSGRGFGPAGIAFVVTADCSLLRLGALLQRLYDTEHDWTPSPEIFHRCAETDSMAGDIIVYFPGITVQED